MGFFYGFVGVAQESAGRLAAHVGDPARSEQQFGDFGPRHPAAGRLVREAPERRVDAGLGDDREQERGDRQIEAEDRVDALRKEVEEQRTHVVLRLSPRHSVGPDPNPPGVTSSIAAGSATVAANRATEVPAPPLRRALRVYVCA
jgi:hypothetical protein